MSLSQLPLTWSAGTSEADPAGPRRCLAAAPPPSARAESQSRAKNPSERKTP